MRFAKNVFWEFIHKKSFEQNARKASEAALTFAQIMEMQSISRSFLPELFSKKATVGALGKKKRRFIKKVF